jgi:hypothetical protein
VQNGKDVAVKSICSPEDVYRLPSECPCIPVSGILEPSASTQITKKSRGHGGSTPHVVSCQGTETTFDTTVSWFLVDQTMQRLTNCFKDLFDQSLLVVAACVFVLYRLFATLHRQVVASHCHHLPHQLQSSLSRFHNRHEYVFSASYIAPIQRPASHNPS